MERSATAVTGICLLWNDAPGMDAQHSHGAFSTAVVSLVGWISCQGTLQVIVPPTRSANAYIFGRRLTSGDVHRNLAWPLQSSNRLNGSCQRLDSNGTPRTINASWAAFPWPSHGNGSRPSRKRAMMLRNHLQCLRMPGTAGGSGSRCFADPRTVIIDMSRLQYWPGERCEGGGAGRYRRSY